MSSVHSLRLTGIAVLLVFAFPGMALSQDATRSAADEMASCMEGLRSPDMNVRRRGIDALARLVPSAAREDLDLGRLLPALRDYLPRWDEASYRAAILLGDLGDTASIPLLHRVLEDARQNMAYTDEDDRHVMAPQRQVACLQALVKLRDEKATAQVLSDLRSEEAKVIAGAVECVAYSDRADLIGALLPLLNDTRDAVNIAPHDAGKYWLRVCDIAVNAIAECVELSVSFKLEHGRKYTPEQRAEVDAKVQELLKRK